jgi:hypothetical protein
LPIKNTKKAAYRRFNLSYYFEFLGIALTLITAPINAIMGSERLLRLIFLR